MENIVLVKSRARNAIALPIRCAPWQWHPAPHQLRESVYARTMLENMRDTAFPWMPGCIEILQTVVPTPFSGQHLMFGSDYSGDHRRSAFRVYAFLVADADNSPAYPEARRLVREAYLSDGRRMSYKRLNDRVRQRALFPFLQAADLFEGLCCVFIVHKDVKWISTGANSLNAWKTLHGLQGKWGVGAFEAMARISHFFSLLLGVVSRPGQHTTWITDQDEIAANEQRLDDVHQFAARMTRLCVDHQMGEFCMNTTAVDGGTGSFEDFVAVPDLLAGMFADVATVWSKHPKWMSVEDELQLLPEHIPAKANAISTWFCRPCSTLRRCAILIERLDPARVIVRPLEVTKDDM